MFGPNTILNSDFKPTIFCHRSKECKNLLTNIKDNLKQKFNLYEYEFAFIPGSSSFGMETIINSLNHYIIPSQSSGKFISRWKEMINTRNKVFELEKGDPLKIECMFETSTTEFLSQDLLNCYHESFIIDAVSSFPFFKIPKNAPIFLICCNKQLGCPSGGVIVGINLEKIHLKKFEYWSTLDLSLYINNIPTTLPIQTFEYLNYRLNSLFCELQEEKISIISKLITKLAKDLNWEILLPPSGFLQKISPAFNVQIPKTQESLLEKYPLYKNNFYNCYQIFTYSHPIEDYLNFDFYLRQNYGN